MIYVSDKNAMCWENCIVICCEDYVITLYNIFGTEQEVSERNAITINTEVHFKADDVIDQIQLNIFSMTVTCMYATSPSYENKLIY